MLSDGYSNPFIAHYRPDRRAGPHPDIATLYSCYGKYSHLARVNKSNTLREISTYCLILQAIERKNTTY